MPCGTTIAANGYLTIWADDGTSASTELHANFKLSKSGEYVVLSDGSQTKLDSVGFGAQTTDRTWGRLPTGTGPWQQLTPTFGAENQAVVLAVASTTALALYPNPADGSVTIGGTGTGEVVLYNTLGQEVRRQTPTSSADFTLSMAELPAGIYYVRLGQRAGRKLVVAH